ncbi:hypothetical protein AAFF_G00410130 [Aldrovandia affinis]|uniref:Uncharacterized protein n=1 Tax=Aldrovandia affinis TaxID=143900 RepID=A0AAD7SBK6_9TELE|nr:hypothetical protein AAFF_G00410130 [Aldrovandia affinis]
MLTINIYHSGTVMVQGTESSLAQFEPSFQPLKEQAEEHKQEPELKTLESEPQNSTILVNEPTPVLPVHCVPNSPKLYSSIRTLRASLAVLEREFTESREETLANSSPSSHTEQANCEIASLLSQHRTEIQELRAATRHLEEDNQALRTELHRVTQELAKSDPQSQKQRLSDATHILIHTGTNDLSTRRIDVAKALRQVAAKARQKYPAAKVTISTLLPRLDVPQRVIHSINVEVSRGCALLPNVNLAHHHDIRHHHLHDQVHLNKEGVKMFAKSKVNAAVYQEILEHFMLPSADKLYGDADFIFQQDLAPAHTAKSTNT